jgi:hypothetical protein
MGGEGGEIPKNPGNSVQYLTKEALFSALFINFWN